jgi:hypothetical protein
VRQLLLNPARKRRSARASLALLFLTSIALVSLSPPGAGPVGAYPMSTPAPISSPSASPTPASLLPYDSSLIFVLDDMISSNRSKANDIVRIHLKAPLVIGGHTVAPAGSPAKIRIVHAEASESGDVYGYVDIFIEPLVLPDSRTIPLRAPTSHLTAEVSAGHESTVGLEDTIGDIFIPGHVLYHAFRKGRNFDLNPGAEIRARTMATVSVDPNGVVAISTPPPYAIELETPHAMFSAAPLTTPEPSYEPAPRHKKGSPPSSSSPGPASSGPARTPEPLPPPTAMPVPTPLAT